MNSHSEFEQTIQRLVDHQLDQSARTQFLLAAEGRPELWKQLAIAFVEEQVWRETIPGMDTIPGSHSRIGNKSLRDSLSRPADRSVRFPFFRPLSLALAAMLLLALTVAVRLATLPEDSQRDEVTASSPRTNLVSNEPYMLQMDDRLKIPLYQHMEPMRESLAGFGARIDPDLQQHFRSAGLELRPNVRYITGNAPDGRSFIIPVQQIRVQSKVQ
jgi:hypothetical protein